MQMLSAFFNFFRLYSFLMNDSIAKKNWNTGTDTKQLSVNYLFIIQKMILICDSLRNFVARIIENALLERK